MNPPARLTVAVACLVASSCTEATAPTDSPPVLATIPAPAAPVAADGLIFATSPGNVVVEATSTHGKNALAAYRRALLAAADLGDPSRRQQRLDDLRRLDLGTPIAALEGCEGSETCEGEDPNEPGIRDYGTTTIISQVTAFVEPSGVFTPHTRCNNVTVNTGIGAPFTQPDCTGWPKWTTLTTTISLTINECPASGSISASTVHVVDSEMAYSNDPALCNETTQDEYVPAAGVPSNPGDEWCLVTHHYINGVYRYTEVISCY